MQINSEGLDLIKGFEGLKLQAYRCSARVWTIGYGHTGDDVHAGLVIDEIRAEVLLQQDVAMFEHGVTGGVQGCAVTGNQFSALVSFAYNVGLTAFLGSTLLRKLKAGDSLGAADEFLRWNRAGGRVLAGLTRRRVAERNLFLRQGDGHAV